MSKFKEELEELISRHIDKEGDDLVLVSYIKECLGNFSGENVVIPEALKEALSDVEQGNLVDLDTALEEEPPPEPNTTPQPHPHAGPTNPSGHRWFDGTSWGQN